MGRVKYLAIVIILCVSLSGENKPSDLPVDINRIEKNIDKLKKSVQSINGTKNTPVFSLKKDPFIPPPISRKKMVKEKEETKEEQQERNELVLYGIVSDGKTSIALINDEVKKEGEFIGDIEIYKIKEDTVLLKQGDRIYPLYIKQ